MVYLEDHTLGRGKSKRRWPMVGWARSLVRLKPFSGLVYVELIRGSPSRPYVGSRQRHAKVTAKLDRIMSFGLMGFPIRLDRSFSGLDCLELVSDLP